MFQYPSRMGFYLLEQRGTAVTIHRNTTQSHEVELFGEYLLKVLRNQLQVLHQSNQLSARKNMAWHKLKQKTEVYS